MVLVGADTRVRPYADMSPISRQVILAHGMSIQPGHIAEFVVPEDLRSVFSPKVSSDQELTPGFVFILEILQGIRVVDSARILLQHLP